MKKVPVGRILRVICILIMLAAEISAITAVLRLNMLPTGYLALLIGVFAAFDVAVGYLLLWKESKRGHIAALILLILLICGSVVIRTVAGDVLKTIEATTREELNAASRAVYVLQQDPAVDLQDTRGYTYGYVNHYDESCTRQVLEEVDRQTSGQVITAGFNTPVLMINALLEGRIDAVVLSGGYLSILEDMPEYAALSESVRVLAAVEVEERGDGETPEAEKPDVPEVTTQATLPVNDEPAEDIVLEPFIVYLSGSDSYDDEIIQDSRSDVNILVAVNPETKQILLLNTPRDYYVENTAGYYQRDKLTHCGMYGIGCSMDTLGNLYDVDIRYYVRINFSGFKKLIDALGGITVYSDYAFTAICRTEIAEGENHLSGQQALDFARERYTLTGGDNERGRHQMQVITAVIEKATSGTTIVSNYSDIMASVEGMFTMNIPIEMVSNLMKMQLSDMARWNIVSYAVTGADSMEECYSCMGMELSVLIPYESSVSKASRLIDMVFSGEILTSEIINNME